MLQTNSVRENSMIWKSYYLAIGMASKYVDFSLQHFLEKGFLQAHTLFRLRDEKKQMNEFLQKELVPSNLANAKYFQGAITKEYMFSKDTWGYYIEKYLFIQKAIMHYGQTENALEYIFQNMTIDLLENEQEELAVLKKYTQEVE